MAETRQDYKALLQALLDRDWLKDPASGIALQAIDKGIESLSEKQRNVLDRYALTPFSIFDMADIFAIDECGYEGTNSEILEWATEVKQQLGYIPDSNSPKGDIGYAEAAADDYGM